MEQMITEEEFQTTIEWEQKNSRCSQKVLVTHKNNWRGTRLITIYRPTLGSTKQPVVVFTIILDPLLRFGKELTIFVISSGVTAFPPLAVTFKTWDEPNPLPLPAWMKTCRHITFISVAVDTEHLYQWQIKFISTISLLITFLLQIKHIKAAVTFEFCNDAAQELRI